MQPLTTQDLGLLVALDALLQEGSVTRAAKRVGLSTPAMSHALARIRERLGDPVLVRSGQGMVLTPRAEALKIRVHALIEEAQKTLVHETPFHPKGMTRSFVVHASDYVLFVLGQAADRLVAEAAEQAVLRFVPNTPDDATLLREGTSDLAIGIYGSLPPELRSRPLLTDRFVCVVRKEHPKIGSKLSLEEFVRLPHLQIAPRGQPGGYVDDVLHEHGHRRHVTRAVPYFLSALTLLSQTDYLLVVSERLARAMAPVMGLRILEVPLPLRPYALSILWHPRFDGDGGHEWLRGVFTQAAKECAADAHPNARLRLLS